MNIKHICDYFIQAFPAINQDEQQLSLSVYRELAIGKPVKIEQLQTSSKLTHSQINQILHSWPGVFFDNEDNVIGFWGMTIQEMPHKLSVNEHTVYAWCAWDSLFLPELIGKTARISSTCPVTARRIELTLTPSHLEIADNKPLFLSFLSPDTDKLQDDVITSFCHLVYFFDSKSVADKWIAEHSGTFLLTLDEAFSIAKQVNAARYNLTLHQ